MTPRVMDSGGGKAGSRNGEEEFASILEACVIEEEIATDHNVRMEVATDTTSGGTRALPTPVLETTEAGPRAGLSPRVTDGGGGKAGNRNDKEKDHSGRR